MELAGGIPLWVFPRGDLPTVVGSIVMPGGAGVQRPGEAGLAQLTAAMLDEGTSTRSAEQIALAAESMGATIDATCGWAGAYVSFKCLKSDFGESLELAADILRHATFPAHEWSRVRGQAVAALRAERDHAESRAVRALLAAIYPDDHPYRFPLSGTEAGAQQLERSSLVDFHSQSLLSVRTLT